jgi:uncharacterized protein YndB with AHSA1/START domain
MRHEFTDHTATRSAQHATFVIERLLPGSPQHAFRFWSEPEMKARWMACHPDWQIVEQQFDFRAGGSEVNRLKTPQGSIHGFRACYLDIVEACRIIYAYEMSADGRRNSTSLVTVEFEPADSHTKMTFTEQAVFLDGLANAKDRQQGTELGFERLAFELGSG